jgi:hypothetical protein
MSRTSSSTPELAGRLRPAHPTRAGDAARHAVVLLSLAAGGTVRRGVTAALRRSRARGDRGDVPGWVLVTLMTAGLVSVLWVLAKDRLSQVFDQAISSVTGQ